jgi:hypothetical protein
MLISAKHHPDLPVTSTMLAETRSTEALNLLLSHTPPDTIDEATLFAFFRRSFSPENLERLPQHNKKLRVSRDLLNACKNKDPTGSYVRILLQHDPSLRIPKDIITLISRSSDTPVLELLDRLGKTVDFTPRVQEVLIQMLNARPHLNSRGTICKLIKHDKDHILRTILGSLLSCRENRWKVGADWCGP